MKHIRLSIRVLAACLAGLLLILVIRECPREETRGGPEASPSVACELRLGSLGKAIVAYRAQHGKLPQAVVSGPRGHKHSWRTLIVPYGFPERDNHEYFHDYRFDEPWDSPHNRELALHGLCFLYLCPSESRNAEYTFVSYLMLVRPNREGPDRGCPEKWTLPDDAVIVVESARCGIEFCEPKDLDWNSLWEGESPLGLGKLNSLHPRVVRAVRVDGKVIDIPKTIDKKRLRNLLNGSGVK